MELSFDDAGPKITMKRILEKVTEEEIYKRYCLEFPGHSIRSPLPLHKDKHPSFGFYVGRNRKWLWKDNATGDRGDVFEFVARMEMTDIRGALQAIADAFNIDGYPLGIITSINGFKYLPPADRQPRERALIQAFHRPYSDSDIECWSRFGIIGEMLIAYVIKVAHEVWMKKQEWPEKRLIWSYKPDNPIFYWTSPYSNNIKCYRPLELDRRHKWLSNMDDLTDIQGYQQADIKHTRPALLLVKSMKEIMFFRGFGIYSMAQNAEGYIINADFIRHLKKYCHPILSLYDRDIAGIRGMIRLKKEYQVPGLVLPSWGAKDPTDLWLHDYHKVYNLLNIIDAYFQWIRKYPGVDAHPFGFRYS